MAHYNREWDELGRNIQDIVDRAVNSHDYQKLNQTITQAVERAVDVGSEVIRKAMDANSRPNSTPYQAVRNLYGSTIGKKIKAYLQLIFGIPFSLFGVLGLLGGVHAGGVIMNLGPVIFLLLILAAGGWLTYRGINTLEMVKRFKVYRRVLGQKTHCSLEMLASSVGKNEQFVRRELRQMISMGFFLQGHLDKEGTALIISDETFRYYEQSRLQLEERRRQEAASRQEKEQTSFKPQIQEVLDRGNAFVAEIRRCNDAIPGEEISAKIYRMEIIVQKIFERTKAHPEIVPDLKKLMDYYLPMTVKLLNAYADMDAQPVQGETIQASKREIEATLDTLNLAFEKLLDSVFQDTAMDVSSDISVLNTMLAQEGLTEDDLSKMKKERSL